MSDSRTPQITQVPLDNRSDYGHSEQEELLKRGLVRVSIAADGLDPVLDRRLKDLRNALRSDAPAGLLGELLPELEQAVLAADSARQERLRSITNALRSLLRQLQKRSPPGDIAKALRQLSKRLDGALAHSSALPGLLEEVVALQDRVLGADAVNPPSEGLWSRLFGAAPTSSAKADTLPNDTSPAAEPSVGVLAGEEQHYSQVASHIETILLNLLSELQILEAQQSRCAQLREKVTQGLNWYELAAALDEMADLIMGAQLHRQAEFEHYLQQLNSRLSQFQGNLEQAHEAYTDSIDEGRVLDGDFHHQVQVLHEDVRTAVDLESLKANVEVQLDALMANVEQSRALREDRETRVGEQLQTMVKRIQVMEVEAQTFRNHLEEQRQRAMIDSLTGLANRAGLQKRMEEEFARWQRYGGELLLAVLDVDHFKQINDRFGHLAGDKVLRLIAQQLQRRLRKSDYIGRFGGEEFVLLLPGTSHEQAAVALDALRAGIEESPFHFKAERVTITLSIGYTAFRQGDTLDQVFDRADRAMYQAKQQGRNRLMLAD